MLEKPHPLQEAVYRVTTRNLNPPDSTIIGVEYIYNRGIKLVQIIEGASLCSPIKFVYYIVVYILI